MRAALKGLAEAMLLRLGPAALSRRALRHRALVLAYHNILPAGEPGGADCSLHLPEADFRAQLDLIEEHAEIVPLGSVLSGLAPAGARPRVVITFDDAYRGAVLSGLPELARRGHPATVFVTPGVLGGDGFWWDRVSEGDAGLPPAFRATALRAGRGRTDEVLALARAQGLRVVPLPPAARPSTHEELATALAAPGLVFGAHTWSHPNLTEVAPADLARELGEPLAWLRQQFPGRVQPWLAYPYGLASPEVESEVPRQGYAAAFRVDGGWLPAAIDGWTRLPRVNIPAGITRDGFALRLTGLLAT